MTTSKICDEQLILCYRQNSKEAYESLLKAKYQAVLPLLKKYATQCKPFGADLNDIYAVFLESFHKAIRRFVFDSITFQTYFLKVLNRDLAGYYRTLSNPNNSSNNCLSLDAEVSCETSLTFHDVLTDSSQKIDSRSFANVNAVYAIMAKEPRTSRDEIMRRIILLKSAGYSVSEIASLTKLKVSSVRRRLNAFYDEELGNAIKKCLL
ncbi:MAG: hypothetical protein PHT30_01775 [Bacilli bacterium]|nr:hypothetical protein [Bacilli bacterium]